MRCPAILAAAASMLLLLLSPGWAEEPETVEQQIAGYTEIIAEGKNWPYPERAALYLEKGCVNLALADYNKILEIWPKSPESWRLRAGAYRRAGRYDRAIADLDQAVRMGGNVFYERAIVNRLAGRYERAVEDFSRVIEGYPTGLDGYANRGLTWLLAGRPDMARTDFIYVWRRLSPSSPYWEDKDDFWLGRFLLYRYLAETKEKAAGIFGFMTGKADEAQSNLKASAKRVDPEKWPGPLVGLFLGEKTPAEVRSAAARVEEEDDRVLQDCEAALFLGEFELSRKNAKGAGPLFEEAVKACPAGYPEYSLAVRELKRLAE
jgi:lipoprotein NlpI